MIQIDMEQSAAQLAVTISTLLFEFDAMDEKARRGFHKRFPMLEAMIDDLATANCTYRDAVFCSAQNIVDKAAEVAKQQDNLTCAALLWVDGIVAEPDGTPAGAWQWTHLPEVTLVRAVNGVMLFAHEVNDINDANNTMSFVRQLPMDQVAEVRNVPLGHPFLDRCVTWTIDNQGEESFRAEMDATRVQAKEALSVVPNPT